MTNIYSNLFNSSIRIYRFDLIRLKSNQGRFILDNNIAINDFAIICENASTPLRSYNVQKCRKEQRSLLTCRLFGGSY